VLWLCFPLIHGPLLWSFLCDEAALLILWSIFFNALPFFTHSVTPFSGSFFALSVRALSSLAPHVLVLFFTRRPGQLLFWFFFGSFHSPPSPPLNRVDMPLIRVSITKSLMVCPPLSPPPLEKILPPNLPFFPPHFCLFRTQGVGFYLAFQSIRRLPFSFFFFVATRILFLPLYDRRVPPTSSHFVHCPLLPERHAVGPSSASFFSQRQVSPSF